MGAVATFDYKTWSSRYPEFEKVPEDLVNLYAEEAALYHANDGSGPVAKVTSQLMLLNMVVAHIAQLNAPKAGGGDVGAPQLVGAIASASEGSVSVSVKNDYPPGTPQWWQQTKYGAAYYAVTAVYRTAHYLASPGRNMNPFFPYLPRR